MATKLWIGGNAAGVGSWNVAANWSPSGVPASGDSVYITGPDSDNQDINAGLDQTATGPEGTEIVLANLTILDNYLGHIGLAGTSYLQVSATRCYLNVTSGVFGANGSPRCKIDFGANQTACYITGSCVSTKDRGLEPIRLLGTHASNTLLVTGKATVGVATTNNAEVSTFASVTAGASGGLPTINLGEGCTLTTVAIGGGTIRNRGADVTTVSLSGGTYISQGSAVHGTVNVRGGTVFYNSDGTLTTAVVGGGATLDFSRDARAKTATNMSMSRGAMLNLDNGSPLSVTITNGIDFVDCSPTDVQIRTWPNVTVTLSAI